MKYFLDTEFLEGKQDKRFLGVKIGETKPTIDLISIGIVDENGCEYYAISKEFNLWEAWNRYDLAEPTTYEKMHGFSGRKIYWIRENVLYPIFYELFKEHNSIEHDEYFGNLNNFIGHFERKENKKLAFKKFKSLILIYGKNNKQIAEEIQDFCLNDYLDLTNSEIKCEFQMKEGDYNYYNCTSPIGDFSTTRHIEKDRINPEFYAYYADYDWVVFCWLFGKMNDLPNGFPKFCIDLKQIYDETSKNLTGKSGKIELKINELIGYFESLKNIHNYPQQINDHHALSDAKWNLQLYQFLTNLKNNFMSSESDKLQASFNESGRTEENNQKNANVQQQVPSQTDVNQTATEGKPRVETGDSNSSEKTPELQPHQLRVVDELEQLLKKCVDLRTFISTNEIFKTLPKDEQIARQAQLFHMEQYAGILQALIGSWKGGNWNQSKGQNLIGDFGIGNEGVFTLKYLSSLLIDATEFWGRDPRRNAATATKIEFAQMMAVKSIFSK